MAAIVVCERPWLLDGDSVRCSNVGEIWLLGNDSPDNGDWPACHRQYDDVHNVAAPEGDQAQSDRASQPQPLLSRCWRRRPTGALVRWGLGGGPDLSRWHVRAGVARYTAKYDTRVDCRASNR